MAESAAQFRRRTCDCAVPPDRCISDETVLVQYTSDRREFRNKPRAERESSVSLLMADGWTLAEVSKYVRRHAANPAVLERAGLRRTTAGALRKVGFAVVHTPGRVAPFVHVSVVWPAEDALETQNPAWTNAVSADFDSCFNGQEG